jgi:hypothetical protein
VGVESINFKSMVLWKYKGKGYEIWRVATCDAYDDWVKILATQNL